MKRTLAIVLALVMVFALAACGSSGSSSSGSSASSSGDGTAITIFNSKMEIQSQMEEMAEEYSAAKGVDVEVYYSNDTVAAHLSTRSAST